MGSGASVASGWVIKCPFGANVNFPENEVFWDSSLEPGDIHSYSSGTAGADVGMDDGDGGSGGGGSGGYLSEDQGVVGGGYGGQG